MATQETIRDVPPDQVDALVSRYKQLGANVQTFPQTNGLVTVVAVFQGAAHSTPFATESVAEILEPVPDAHMAATVEFSKSTAFSDLAAEYLELFNACQIRPSKGKEVEARVEHLIANEPRYRALGMTLQIPWYFIGIVHSMEANFSFTSHVHNGDPLDARTIQEPKGRPIAGNPPFSWEQSATDAFTLKKLVALSKWDTAESLYRLEAYNGFGYRSRGIATPYLWSYSQHYIKGKFVADHKFDANAVSKQAGAAVLLKALQAKAMTM